MLCAAAYSDETPSLCQSQSHTHKPKTKKGKKNEGKKNPNAVYKPKLCGLRLGAVTPSTG